MGALLRVGLARPQLAVDLAEGLGLVLAQVLLEGRADDDLAGPVLFGEEDLERLARPMRRSSWVSSMGSLVRTLPLIPTRE